MRWCLAEAARTLDRRFLKDCYTIALMQDGRKKRLLVRYKASDVMLNTRRGVLGQAALTNLTAMDLRNATMHMIREFCTPGHGAPSPPKDMPPPKLDEALLEHVIMAIEQFNSDAAKDEQNAGALLREANPEPALAEVWNHCPNLKIVSRDRAHASRRLTKRPWKADGFLEEVMSKVIHGKTSITNLIQHSHVFSGWFTENVQKVLDKIVKSVRTKDLSHCKPRFDSEAKPMSRAILYHEAILMTAQQISINRQGSAPGNSADQFIEYACEEVFLQLAMLGDGADEALVHTRFCDDENVDNGLLPHENDRFLTRIMYLFGDQEGCFKGGHTAVMLKNLRRPVVLFWHGQPKTIGGEGSATHEIMQRCRHRMLNWARLAKLVVKAEFPSFDVLVAFSAFNVASTGERGKHVDLAGSRPQLKLIARVLGLNETILIEAYDLVKPLAVKKKAAIAELSNVGAWKHAIEHIAQARCMNDKVAVLLAALCRYAAWAGSSVGCEHSLSFFQWALESRVAWRSNALEVDELQLLSDRDASEDNKLYELAQEIWKSTGYGKARKPHETRLDAGLTGGFKRKLNAFDHSEASWIKKRRQEVSNALEDVGVASATKKELNKLKIGGRGWTQAHDDEALFQRAKRMSYLIDGCLDGSVDIESLDKDSLEIVLAEIERREVASKKSATDRQRRNQVFKIPSKPELQGKHVFIEPNVTTPAVELTRAAREHGWDLVADRTEAHVYVLANPGKPGQRTAWCAALRGGVLTTSEYVLTGGVRGAAIAYRAEHRARHTACATEAFREAHPVVYDILNVTTKQRNSRWRWLDTLEEVAAIKDEYRRNGRDAELIIFVGHAEFHHRPEAVACYLATLCRPSV